MDLAASSVWNLALCHKVLLKFCTVWRSASQVCRKDKAALSNRTDRASRRLQVKIGVPKEIKTQEYLVGLTPGAVREYVAAGHGVVVETNAGAGIGATDDDYRRAGAAILDSVRDAFASSDMIVKVKEPQPSEWTLLRANQILFTYPSGTRPRTGKGSPEVRMHSGRLRNRD
jgi:hypothetical protein